MRGIVAAAVAAALAACALLLPSCASGEATVLPLAGGEAAVSEDGAASEAESGGATEAKASDDPEDPGDAEASAADLDEADEGASPEGLEPTGDELAARMDAYLAANFPRAGAPGLAVAVVDAGGVRYLRTFGDCPDADAPFVVGSLSKSFTAVAVMQLVEQGAVDLDAPASRYAPGYDVPDEVTVRSLLNQTSGFGAYDSLAEAADGELGETFGAFSYANANYDLLGRVVEGASGEDYACYLDEHVLEPLGMASTTADPARAEALGMVPGHRDWFGLPVADGFRHAQGDGAWGGPASGYVASSVRDMASYLRMYLNGGMGDGARVLSADSVRRMFLDRVPDPEGDTYYGMGWTSFSWDDGELVLSHDGQVENYTASMCLLPERGIGIVALSDANDNAGGNIRFFDLVGGVVSVAIGGTGQPMDDAWTWAWRQRVDVLYASALLLAVSPLLLTGRWRRRLSAACRGGVAPIVRARSLRMLLVRGVLLHVALPACILALPFVWGVPWRDLLTFSPDVSTVLLASAGLLVVAGAVRLAAAVTLRNDEPPPSIMR
ncbi:MULTISPECIES: serine hydrolase domain-containing protein [Eggerthella]|uniref:serine hydrolase domain-containing protein n=1 Tax=Eggerthella TaxID=84111 RepID=UPI001E5F0B28|nr:serine hydrolase domain-containing protein [Eggerthella lenta]MDU2447983.1 serine hydrolase [Eggerthella sp.]MCG4877274.1 serine hydrolase [Eggerthella lenta]MCQ5240497.1 serine hydrolase [Eggerthella lenta]MDB1740974.1 serine hydrolase [Eggerthella lenta]MDB1743925.1 serine hydrolase [Eggerthella lenta]